MREALLPVSEEEDGGGAPEKISDAEPMYKGDMGETFYNLVFISYPSFDW